MKKVKRISCIIIALIAVLCFATMAVSGAEIAEEETVVPTVVNSGECGAEGDNVLWTLYSDGLLEITGSGDMADYSSGGPWGTQSSGVAKVVISEGVTRIGNASFQQCIDIIDVSIPNTVTNIGERAFDYCNKLKSVNIPIGVIVIEDSAFWDCRRLVNVSLPDGLKTIGKQVFSTTDLTSIVIPDTVTEIGSFAFAHTELTGINIPASVKTLGEGVFLGCDKLTYVEIPETVTNIGPRLFESSGVADVKLPDNMKEIPYRMFWYCNNLTHIKIPDSVTKIDYNAFWYARNLSSITIPSNVKEIGSDAFGHTNLNTIHIPASVETIGTGAFRIPGLSSITVAEANANYKSVDGVLFNKDMTEFICYPAMKTGESYDIPATVETIKNYAFYYVKHLANLTIPRSFTKTEHSNGYDCSYCNNLKDIYYKGTQEEWNKINGIKGSGLRTKTIHYHESHTMSDWLVDSEATCQTEGEKSRYCTYDCGYSETETIPVAVHSYGSWYMVKNATCAENGQQKRDCAFNCGNSETKTIAAKGHTDNNPLDGYCDVCGAETEATKNCSCNCHKTGFMGFIWKLQRFFFKLFKTNKACACGMAHY